jgi:hypothetical protein
MMNRFVIEPCFSRAMVLDASLDTKVIAAIGLTGASETIIL